jgi:Ras-related GTP-binding protein C/D
VIWKRYYVAFSVAVNFQVFLIDVISKIYITTDSSPFDSQTYELCGDMIDVVIDVSCIYGMKDENEVGWLAWTESISFLFFGLFIYVLLCALCSVRGDGW